MVRSRHAGRVDENQKEIVDAYRKAGATVHITSNAGDNFPDLVVGYMGRNFLVEVIGEAKLKRFKKNGGLSDGQLEWHTSWRGVCHAVRTIEQALAVIGIAQVPFKGEID